MSATWTAADSDAARKQGWDIWECPAPEAPYQLEKLDESTIFRTDAAAIAHVLKRSREGDPLAQRALTFLMERSPAEHAAIFELARTL